MDKREQIEEKWNVRAATFDADHATEDLEKWKEMLESLIGLEGKGRVLDIGTGTGFLANMIAEMGYESFGIDFARGMLDLAIAKATDRDLDVHYILGDGEKLPFDDNTFDAIVNCRVLWTLVDPVSAFKEWKRVLKPGGRLLSFVRIMTREDRERMRAKTANAAPSSSVHYPEELENSLPLRTSTLEEHLAAYAEGGFIRPSAILVGNDVTLKEGMKPWYAIQGVK